MDYVITDYQTASGKTLEELDGKIKKLIEEGYQPYGSPGYSTGANSQLLACQAMVLFEEIEEEAGLDTEY
jgi:hypothetical protein